jgi:hypothetical protein
VSAIRYGRPRACASPSFGQLGTKSIGDRRIVAYGRHIPQERPGRNKTCHQSGWRPSSKAGPSPIGLEGNQWVHFATGEIQLPAREVSYIYVDKFRRESPDGSQHHALRRLISADQTEHLGEQHRTCLRHVRNTGHLLTLQSHKGTTSRSWCRHSQPLE